MSARTTGLRGDVGDRQIVFELQFSNDVADKTVERFAVGGNGTGRRSAGASPLSNVHLRSLSCRNGVHRSAPDDYEKLGTAPGFCHHCHTGRCPVGVTTQDAILEKRLEPDVGAKRVRNYLKALNMELTTIVRACGKQSAHHLEREDLVALTVEAAAMARLPLAWTSWIPGNFLSGNTLLREKRGLKMRLLQSRACNLLTH